MYYFRWTNKLQSWKEYFRKYTLNWFVHYALQLLSPKCVCIWLYMYTHRIRSVQLRQLFGVPYRVRRTSQMTWCRSPALFHFVLDVSKLKILTCETDSSARQTALAGNALEPPSSVDDAAERRGGRRPSLGLGCLRDLGITVGPKQPLSSFFYWLQSWKNKKMTHR